MISGLVIRVRALRSRVASDIRYHRQKLAECRKHTPNARYHQERIDELRQTVEYLQTFKIKDHGYTNDCERR